MCSSADWRRPAAAGSAREGFVLLEAVVALAIIGLVAIALLETTGTQLRAAAQANTLLVARSIAQDRLAALELLDHDELGDLPDSLAKGTMPAPFDDFSWTASVAEMEDEYDLFGAQVVVTGRGESFPLSTLIHSPRPVLQTQGQTGGATGGAGGRGGSGATRGGPAAGGRGGSTVEIPRGGR